MAQKWARSEAVVAQKMDKNQIGGFFRKDVIISPGEECIVEKNGQIVQKFGPGKHNIGGKFDKSLTSVTFIDIAEKTVRRTIEKLWTKDYQQIGADAELKIKVVSSDSLFGNLLRTRSIILIDDIWNQAAQEFLARVAMPEVKKRDAGELYGNRDMLDRLKTSIEVEMRKTLRNWGIDLVSFSLVWNLPPEFEAHMKGMGARKRVEAEKELDRGEEISCAVHERNVAKIKGGRVKPVEEVRAEMENERVKREVELNLEKEETQEDMEEAMMALKLKRLKDRQKGDVDAEEKIKEFEALKDEAESNYYKKKIDEATFMSLVNEYEKQISELRMKEKKK
jgi:hypothetical protein